MDDKMKKGDIPRELELLNEYIRLFEERTGWLNEIIETMNRDLIHSDLIISFLDLNEELEIRRNLNIVNSASH